MENIQDRVTKLLPRIERTATYNFPEDDTVSTPNDLAQDMAAHILSRSALDPHYNEQNDQYLVKGALMNCAPRYRRQSQYQKRFVGFEPSADGEESEVVQQIDLYPDDGMSVEGEVVINETLAAIFGEVDGSDLKIIKMSFMGYSNLEIANELGVSAPAISQHKNKIREIAKRIID